ncbi:hypothetical protein RND81_13G179400 [Saponaria officinalis]|uniref:F-box domain-containing protein n=1 Tax=Saponaria officinalis TaxID=3572 RepID=A0AAW1GZ30_SAPOF
MAPLKRKAKSEEIEDSSSKLMALDLLIYIFVRLSVETLLRLKSVCKYWNSIISSREFAELYQQHATSIPSLNLFMVDNYSYVCDEGIANKLYTFKIDSSDVDELYKSNHTWQCTLSKPAHELDHKLKDAKIYPIGSCNGLICYIVGLGHSILHLWNPATHQYSHIKGPRLSKYSNPLYWGFGYDPLSDDYKILVLGVELGKPFARIYRPRTGRWRRIECPSAQQMSDFIMVDRKTTEEIELGSLAVLVGQTLYWRVKNLDNLLSFDLTRESFAILDLPAQGLDPLTLHHHICEDFFICQLRQCLCACWIWNESGNNDRKCARLYITVWMLEGDGVWKKLFKFGGLERGITTVPKLFEMKEQGKYLIPNDGFKTFFLCSVDGEKDTIHPNM